MMLVVVGAVSFAMASCGSVETTEGDTTEEGHEGHDHEDGDDHDHDH